MSLTLNSSSLQVTVILIRLFFVTKEVLKKNPVVRHNGGGVEGGRGRVSVHLSILDPGSDSMSQLSI